MTKENNLHISLGNINTKKIYFEKLNKDYPVYSLGAKEDTYNKSKVA